MMPDILQPSESGFQSFYDEELVPKRVVISDSVWIGRNVCIVSGVTIGEGAVGIRDVRPCAVVGGNPARVLKHRDQDRYQRLIREGRYGLCSGTGKTEVVKWTDTQGDTGQKEGATVCPQPLDFFGAEGRN